MDILDDRKGRSGHKVFGTFSTLRGLPIDVLVWDFDVAGFAVDTAFGWKKKKKKS